MSRKSYLDCPCPQCSSGPVGRLVYASVDDTRSTLPHEKDKDVLEQAYTLCLRKGYKSKAVLIRRRMAQLEMGGQ